MALRGRRSTRPRRVQRRRRPGMRGMRRMRRVASKVHAVKRLAQPAFIQNTSLGPTMTNDGDSQFIFGSPIAGALPGTYEYGFSSQFQLKSVVEAGDLTPLFDRYKITGVALKVHYLQNASFIPGNTANLPTIHYAFDGDDSDVPATANSVLVKGYCKSRVLNANRPLQIFLKPRITKEIYNSPLTTGYSSEKACWLDCNSSAIPHFGLKVWITDWVGGSDNNNALRIQPVYYLKLRDTQ